MGWTTAGELGSQYKKHIYLLSFWSWKIKKIKRKVGKFLIYKQLIFYRRFTVLPGDDEESSASEPEPVDDSAQMVRFFEKNPRWLPVSMATLDSSSFFHL